MNVQGLLYFLRTLGKPSMFKPHYSVKTINEIHFENLRKNGIKYIVFDKDNTLTVPYEFDIPQQLKNGLYECQNAFGSDKIAILSNSVGSKDDKGYKVV